MKKVLSTLAASLALAAAAPSAHAIDIDVNGAAAGGNTLAVTGAGVAASSLVTGSTTGANLSLTPFATWAGDVSIALGGEYREEKIRGTVPAEFQPTINPNGTTSNRWSVGNYLPFRGSYNVKEAYLETLIPLGFGL